MTKTGQPLAPFTRFRTGAAVGLLRLENPKGGPVLDLYGPGRLLPESVVKWLDADRIKHLLDRGLIEFCDNSGTPSDPGRVIECWGVLVSFNVPKDAGRPRVADILHRNGCHYSNETLSRAIALYRSDWKLGDEVPQ